MSVKNELLFDGNEKRLYATDDSRTVIIHYKDVATAFGGIKKAVLKSKGICNNRISAILFSALSRAGVPNHFLNCMGDREQLCRKVENIPLQIVVRNRLAGTTAELLGVENGTKIPNVVYELRYNCDRLGDPMINEHHAVALGIVSYDDLNYILSLARKANEVLKEYLLKAGIELVDFKLEFGKTPEGEFIICDEISPDNSRLWDMATGQCLDKDRFRHDMSDVCASYREVMNRLVKLEAEL